MTEKPLLQALYLGTEDLIQREVFRGRPCPMVKRGLSLREALDLLEELPDAGEGQPLEQGYATVTAHKS